MSSLSMYSASFIVAFQYSEIILFNVSLLAYIEISHILHILLQMQVKLWSLVNTFLLVCFCVCYMSVTCRMKFIILSTSTFDWNMNGSHCSLIIVLILGLIKKLEEENQINSYLCQDKIPKVFYLMPFWMHYLRKLWFVWFDEIANNISYLHQWVQDKGILWYCFKTRNVHVTEIISFRKLL